MQASSLRYDLEFLQPSGTSRGIMTSKETWFLKLQEAGRVGVGECGILRSLSYDDRPDYAEKLQWVCRNIDMGESALRDALVEFPSIQAGVEMAFRSIEAKTPFQLFPSAFTRGEAGIPINGLVWMGEKRFMKEQIEAKIDQGFSCIKLKIGAIDFEDEVELLRLIRKEFSREDIEIRVDANGAFPAEEAIEKLERLSRYRIHSIEQPIKAGQPEAMARVCKESPIPVALDEELIGVLDVTKKRELLQTIGPAYIILKPSLIGGYEGTNEWIEKAEDQGIGWWITSALESNIGLSGIAQYTFNLGSEMFQGLGTGGLYGNNIPSPLYVREGKLWYGPENQWNFNLKG